MSSNERLFVFGVLGYHGRTVELHLLYFQEFQFPCGLLVQFETDEETNAAVAGKFGEKATAVNLLRPADKSLAYTLVFSDKTRANMFQGAYEALPWAEAAAKFDPVAADWWGRSLKRGIFPVFEDEVDAQMDEEEEDSDSELDDFLPEGGAFGSRTDDPTGRALAGTIAIIMRCALWTEWRERHPDAEVGRFAVVEYDKMSMYIFSENARPRPHVAITRVKGSSTPRNVVFNTTLQGVNEPLTRESHVPLLRSPAYI